MSARGGTVAFNLLTRTGRVVPYGDVERRAETSVLQCAAAASAIRESRNVPLPSTRIAPDNASSPRRLDGFTIDRFATCLGGDTPVGAVRASLGLANNARDVRCALDLIAAFE